jgi:hypothetical protein
MSEYTVTFTLTEGQLCNIILGARSMYWLGSNYSLHSDGKSLSIDTDLIDGIPVINRAIGPQQIAEALQRMVGTDQITTLKRVLESLDNGRCYADGDTCDNVLQVAVFGRVVFG